MYAIIETENFSAWLTSLKDPITRLRLLRRLNKAKLGNLGDVKPVGAGVYEMREFFGSGWRMYYIVQGSTVIFMLGGGNKSTQKRDIETAIAMAAELQHEQNHNQHPNI